MSLEEVWANRGAGIVRFPDQEPSFTKPSDITQVIYTEIGQLRYATGTPLDKLVEGQDYHVRVIPYDGWIAKMEAIDRTKIDGFHKRQIFIKKPRALTGNKSDDEQVQVHSRVNGYSKSPKYRTLHAALVGIGFTLDEVKTLKASEQPEEVLVIAHAKYRERAKYIHPDRSKRQQTEMQELNLAYERVKKLVPKLKGNHYDDAMNHIGAQYGFVHIFH